mmetsp:Transcript_86118/g.229831  ORF Transcript_86118/g.229831 Transcript_86118/m.229831 type:complete len:372 (-) Transcript_86118:71-1186(-)
MAAWRGHSTRARHGTQTSQHAHNPHRRSRTQRVAACTQRRPAGSDNRGAGLDNGQAGSDDRDAESGDSRAGTDCRITVADVGREGVRGVVVVADGDAVLVREQPVVLGALLGMVHGLDQLHAALDRLDGADHHRVVVLRVLPPDVGVAVAHQVGHVRHGDQRDGLVGLLALGAVGDADADAVRQLDDEGVEEVEPLEVRGPAHAVLQRAALLVLRPLLPQPGAGGADQARHRQVAEEGEVLVGGEHGVELGQLVACRHGLEVLPPERAGALAELLGDARRQQELQAVLPLHDLAGRDEEVAGDAEDEGACIKIGGCDKTAHFISSMVDILQCNITNNTVMLSQPLRQTVRNQRKLFVSIQNSSFGFSGTRR